MLICNLGQSSENRFVNLLVLFCVNVFRDIPKEFISILSRFTEMVDLFAFVVELPSFLHTYRL